MRAIKIDNIWRVVLIEREDLRKTGRRVHDRLEESLRGYKFSDVVVPSSIWEDFQRSDIKIEIDRLLRISMRFKPDIEYLKLEESPLVYSIETALKNKDNRHLIL